MPYPAIKRIVHFNSMHGKTIERTEEIFGAMRIVFTDGTFADVETDHPTAKPTLRRGKPSRYEIRRRDRGME